MSLAGKYLKYSPEITLEIFTLIWDKLKLIFPNGKIYDWVKVWDFDTFKERGYISIWGSNKYCFGINCCPGLGNYTEATVQEILGYDPFVKEFVLPEKWYVPVTDETAKDINIFKSKTRWYEDAIGYKAVGYEGVGYNNLPNDYIKITFDQFKKYVLKETIETQEKVTFEYVECIENIYGLEIGKIYHVDNNLIKDGRYNNYSIINNNRIKASTKEAFDAQNQPKSIEKWSVGSYGVVINSTNKRFPIGFIDKIISAVFHKKVEFENYHSYDPGNLKYSYGLEFKWFATKFEAEEFAKTLVEPVKKEIKQPLKQAVHCKTQEEWDFVTEKIGYKFTTKFELRVSDTINPSSRGCESKSFFERRGEYNLLSFQEWCNLNGYKMESNQEFKVGDWVCHTEFGTIYQIIEFVLITETIDNSSSSIDKVIFNDPEMVEVLPT